MWFSIQAEFRDFFAVPVLCHPIWVQDQCKKAQKLVWLWFSAELYKITTYTRRERKQDNLKADVR